MPEVAFDPLQANLRMGNTKKSVPKLIENIFDSDFWQECRSVSAFLSLFLEGSALDSLLTIVKFFFTINFLETNSLFCAYALYFDENI